MSVATLAVAVLRGRAMARMAVGAMAMTRAVVALIAALTICATVRLGRVTRAALRTLGLLRGRLQALERFGGLDEASR